MGVLQTFLKRIGYEKATGPSPSKSPSRRDIEDKFSQYGVFDDDESSENEYNNLLAFNRHPWLFAGVSAIARNAARLPRKIEQIQADGTWKEITTGWPVDILRNPNKWTSQNKLFFAISAFLSLSGDAFLEKQMDEKTGTPLFLYPLLPTAMDAVRDPVEKIKYWKYSINNRTIPLMPEDVIQFTEFNPLSEYYGTGAPSPLKATLMADWYSQAWVQAYFENGPHATGVFVTPKELDLDVFNRLKENIKSAFSGSRKNHKSMFLDSDIKFQKLSVDPKEADLTPLRDMHIREILAVLGVPRMLVQDSKEAAWANADAQLTTFWREKMRPHCDSIDDVLNHDLFNPYGFRVVTDYSGIAALAEDDKRKADIGNIASQTGALTINEIRKKYFDLPEVPWGNVAPAKTAPAAFAMSALPLGLDKAADAPAETAPARIAHIRKAHYPRFKAMIEEHFAAQKKACLDALAHQSGKFQKAAGDVSIDVLLSNVTRPTERLINKAVKLYEKSGEDFRDAGYTLVKPGQTPPDYLTPAREAYMNQAVKKFADEIDKTTLADLRATLAEGLDANETMPDIQARIQKVFQGEERGGYWRADTIARTEMLKVENYNALQGYQDAGANFKKWIASGPPDDRPEHTAMDGETVPIDEAFSNGLMYPGDPAGDPKDICNCRCAVAPVLENV